MQIQYLSLQIKIATTIAHPTNTKYKDAISITNAECKDNISPYKYRMPKHYLTYKYKMQRDLQMENAKTISQYLILQQDKTISHITKRKCKDNISPYKKKIQRQYLTLQIQNAKTMAKN